MKRKYGLGKHLQVWMAVAMLIGATGCATKGPVPLEPRVTGTPEAPRVKAAEAKQQEGMSGELITFGKLRTVLQTREQIVGENGAETQATEIRPEMEKELVQRDFRLFSGLVAPDSDIATVTRETKAHVVISVDARSEFVNNTGKFAKYRATGEAKAVRGHDGTILASAKVEQMGPRNQDVERAGKLALRGIAQSLTDEVVNGLLAKTDQLLWAGILVNNVASMDGALRIQNAIEKKSFVSYVELLEWDKDAGVATFEIIYGLKHESDVASLLQDIPGLKIKPSKYEPGRMEVLKKTVSRYK